MRSARDDYPVLAGFDYCSAVLDEIDRLRSAYDALVTEAAAEHQCFVDEAEFLRCRVMALAKDVAGDDVGAV